MKILVLLAGVIALFSVGCLQGSGSQANESALVQATIETTGNKTFSLDEIGKHGSREDCWMAIGGKVFNVATVVSKHPGGEAILEGCGKNATELFETRPSGSKTPHSQKARDYLNKYYVGDLG